MQMSYALSNMRGNGVWALISLQVAWRPAAGWTYVETCYSTMNAVQAVY